MVRALSKQPIVTSASVGEDSDDFCSQKNLDINLVGCQFDMCHYGVVVEDKVSTYIRDVVLYLLSRFYFTLTLSRSLSLTQRCSLAIMSTWFYDIPRPIYLVRHALARFELRNNTYKYYTEKLVGPLDEDVSSDDHDGKCKELTTEEQCEELFSQVRGGNVEAATKVLETLKLIEKEGISEVEGDEMIRNLASSSNDIPKVSSSENESTSRQDKPKTKVEKIKPKVGGCKDKEGPYKPDNGNVAERSQEAPKYVTEAVKKVLEMGSEPDFKAGCCNNIPKLSSSENVSTSKQSVPNLNTQMIKQNLSEPKGEEGISKAVGGIDSRKAQKGPKNGNEQVKMESELDSKANECNAIPKPSSSANTATSEQARLKLKAKRNFKGLSESDGGKDSRRLQECSKNTNIPADMESQPNLKESSFNDISKLSSSEKQARPKLRAKKIKQNSGDPKSGEGISEADCGKGTAKAQQCPQTAKEAVQKMKEEFMEQEEVKCTATTCNSPIVVSLPLPAPRRSESTEEILRR